MTANDVQALLLQHVAADTRSRRRSLPPSLSVPLSQWVNQRWRERPRCPALRVTPGRRDGVVHAIVGRAACRCLCTEVVQEERAARVHVFVSRFAGRRRLADRTDTCSGTSNVFPEKASRLQTQIQASHHRALDTGAVLSVVNALRSASTRPVAGPAGIDDASARHVFSNYAMVGNLSITRRRLTRESRRRMLTSSSVPLGTPSVRRHGQRSAHPAVAHRARYRAQLLNIAA